MESNDGNDGGKKGAEARAKASGYGSIGVAAMAMAVAAVAIFAGTRHSREASVAAQVPVAAAAAPVAAPEAPSAKHPPRRLQGANRHELETTLPKGAPVEITANAGDPEAFQLAEQIHAFLLAKGYSAADVTRSVSTPPAKGVGLEPLAEGKWRVIVGSADE